ncbi:MAG: cell division protein FtsL [Bacilli bacterium]|nr:cell division protein FtsL [Bacilli bacterium]
MRKTGKKVKFLKGEKFMYLLLALLVVAIPVAKVCTQAILSESNIKVEKLKKDITKQQRYNESLSMKISELASLENIENIANELGLSYNNDNIKTVSE